MNKWTNKLQLEVKLSYKGFISWEDVIHLMEVFPEITQVLTILFDCDVSEVRNHFIQRRVTYSEYKIAESQFLLYSSKEHVKLILGR